MTAAPLMLSVSGARGIVGESMTPEVAARFAAALEAFVREMSDEKEPLICIGRDTRPSGEALAAAALDALVARGCRVIDLGIVATPTAGLMIAERKAVGGIVITASHNPGQWNGLKALDASGAAPPPAHVERIIHLFKAAGNETATANATRPLTPDPRLPLAEDPTRVHVNRVLRAIDPAPIRAARLKVVLDSVNGAGCTGGRMLLEALGCEVVHINGEPTGEFAHPPEPLEENLRDLARRTRTERAACGFAQDPDADRLAAIDGDGRYIGEEYTLVLAAKRVLEARGGGAIVANLSTSRMIDDLAAHYRGAAVVRSAVGEANVVAKMREVGAIVGGEGNGGVILPPPHGVCWVRDSLSAMALILGLLAAEERPLAAIIEDLPRYAMVKEKFDLAKIGRDAIAVAIERVKRVFAGEQVNASDGVRLDFTSEGAWVHLRPSNTEPIVRIIAEARTDERARQLIDEVRVAAAFV